MELGIYPDDCGAHLNSSVGCLYPRELWVLGVWFNVGLLSLESPQSFLHLDFNTTYLLCLDAPLV